MARVPSYRGFAPMPTGYLISFIAQSSRIAPTASKDNASKSDMEQQVPEREEEPLASCWTLDRNKTKSGLRAYDRQHRNALSTSNP